VLALTPTTDRSAVVGFARIDYARVVMLAERTMHLKEPEAGNRKSGIGKRNRKQRPALRLPISSYRFPSFHA